jgi:glycosyltransferase involved in cell wall biosynthesis
MRVLVAGFSERAACGVRDHGRLLAEELERRGARCEIHWLDRRARTLGGGRRELASWRRQLTVRLAGEPVDAIVLHYSVFSLSHRGLPLFVPATAAALRRTRIPVVTVMHEIVYPWGKGGLRGRIWALSQRAVLPAVVGVSAAVVATADFRVRWLQTRRWVPRRPVGLAPVFSNLPAPAASARPVAGSETVGMFGYAFGGAEVELVLDAIAALRRRGRATRLLLLGSPGPDSAAGREWSQAATRRGLQDALAFTGVLPAQELADAMGACEVLLYADPTGPASRKGTLAGALASGRPLVSVDGPRRWQELVDARATALVERTPEAIAGALELLLADEREREELGARGGAFARERMGLALTGEVVLGFLAELVPAAQDPAGRSGSQAERAVR